MRRSLKLSLFCVVLLSITLAACAPTATPAPATPTNPPPTSTVAPTAKPLPTSTPRSAYKSLPMPTPSPAGMFDVGGHKMNLECYGTGSPTVVLEQDWFVTLNDQNWNTIIPSLAAETRVCAYDRFNTGASDSIGSHTFQNAAEEWHALMQAAKIEPPYLVAGNGLGGLFALMHASRYPDEVVGAVLIDSAHVPTPEKWSAALPAPAPDEPAALHDLRERLKSATLRGLPLDEQSTLEGIDLIKVGPQQIQAIKSLGRMPLIVLVEAPQSKNFGQSWPGIPTDVAARLDQVGVELQKDYAALSSDSQLIIADHAGHYIQNDEPELVVNAISALLDKARQK
jgi:pimeloyl-ACP methyl ester carboxylesterase